MHLRRDNTGDKGTHIDPIDMMKCSLTLARQLFILKIIEFLCLNMQILANMHPFPEQNIDH